MTWPKAPIGSFCRIGSGTTPPRAVSERYYGGSIPWVKSGELRETDVFFTGEMVTEAALRETPLKLVPSGSILVAMYGATVGRVGMLRIDATTNQAICHIVPDPAVADNRFVYHCIAAHAPYFVSRGAGGAQPNITQSIVQNFEMGLPPLHEQRRLAAILDQADDLRRKRRLALDKLNALPQAIFHEMFGDPALNLRKWPILPLGFMSIKFSDGPFGSNLKTADYVEEGVRVVRLQNIGSDDFRDSDAVYITEKHFAALRKHACAPGDVLIATLGDPNLRASILPTHIRLALNKADCVQMRCDPLTCTPEYIVALLNNPATEQLAQSKILGQTRLRISMGRLRELELPLPPLSSQLVFSEYIARVAAVKLLFKSQLSKLDILFSSLQHRAFAGELTPSAVEAILAPA